MKSKSIAVIGFLVLVALVCGFMVWRERPKGPPTATVVFLGFTNNAAGLSAAQFSLSNTSPWAIELNGSFLIGLLDSQGVQTNLQGGALGKGGTVLAPGDTEIVTIPRPASQYRWQVIVPVSKHEPALIDAAMELFIEAQKLGFPTKVERTSHGIVSPPIDSAP